MRRSLLAMLMSVSVLFGGDIIIKSSDHSVDETIERIKTIVTDKGLDIFAIIDHQQNATGVDMQMRPSKVIIFGNPKMGTVLMQQAIRSGLDLPLRILVYEDGKGHVQMAYRDGTWLKEEHAIVAPKLISKLDSALDKITTKAGKE